MFRRVIAVLVVSCFLLNPALILAAQGESTAEFKAKKDKAENKLKEIEALLDKVLKEKRVSKRADELDSLQKEHVESLNNAVKQAIADVDEADKSKGKRGSFRSFADFENMAVDHEKRGKAIEARINDILAKIKEGDVELDGSLLESMTPAERKEYMEYMTPSGREKMKKKQPKLLSGIAIETRMNLVDLGDITRPVGRFCSSASDTIGDFLAPPAEAAIGAAAGATCGATGGIACAAAVVGVVYAYARATDDYLKCIAGQCGCAWYKPWCCTGRTGCYIAYLTQCA